MCGALGRIPHFQNYILNPDSTITSSCAFMMTPCIIDIGGFATEWSDFIQDHVSLFQSTCTSTARDDENLDERECRKETLPIDCVGNESLKDDYGRFLVVSSWQQTCDQWYCDMWSKTVTSRCTHITLLYMVDFRLLGLVISHRWYPFPHGTASFQEGKASDKQQVPGSWIAISLVSCPVSFSCTGRSFFSISKIAANGQSRRSWPTKDAHGTQQIIDFDSSPGWHQESLRQT